MYRATRLFVLIVALAVTLTACGGGSDNSNSSSIAVTITRGTDHNIYSVAPRTVTIDLGALNYWKLHVKVHNLTWTNVWVDLAVAKISNPDAKILNTSTGVYPGGDDCTCSQRGSFTAKLVAGNYYLIIDGKKEPVTVNVVAPAIQP